MPRLHRLPVHAGRRAPNYRMAAKADRGEIFIYDIIGSSYWGGVSAKSFKDDLRALGAVKTIDVHINSDGGDVFEGRTIFTLLQQHEARIIVHVDGLAASIASLIAMAGDEVRMGEGTYIMIHNAWGVGIGEAKDMRRTADLLDSVTGQIRESYVARTGNTDAQCRDWMDEETWFTAAEAKANGFADVIEEPVKAAALLIRDLVPKDELKLPIVKAEKRFRHLPAALRPNRARAAAAIAAMAR